MGDSKEKENREVQDKEDIDEKKDKHLSEDVIDPEEVDLEKMEEILEDLPGEEGKVLRQLMISRSSMTSSPFPPQFLRNINEKHIDKLLDISDKTEDREFNLKINKKITNLYMLF